MHLIEGAKWSDGEPFTADDVMFYWEENVLRHQRSSAERRHARRRSAKARS